MSRPAALCPSCGAPIVFQWSSSVQTTCPHCRSILIRKDVNLERVGVVSDLPPDSSPIQLGAAGVYENRAFTVAGRIIYDYAGGSWNEWHIVLNTGGSAWLSDAQSQYVVTVAAPAPALPPLPSVQLGGSFNWNNTAFAVTAITTARYRGVEGELPFEYWDKHAATFVDLRSTAGDFATLDYSDAAPVLYVGKAVEFDDLKLKNLRAFEGWS
ncbi:MAG TPA: DUF4178 domain-containing protein [Bryobacteraceae bacterium]|nr:DUF4178 domain-containing protein [Bryobacteraceae bacterium]